MTAAERLFDVESVGKEMLAEARKALAGRGREVRKVGEAEIRRLAGVLADIGSRVAKGELTPKEAKRLVQIHQATVASVLRSLEGLSVLASRDALRALTRVAAGALSRFLGFKLR